VLSFASPLLVQRRMNSTAAQHNMVRVLLIDDDEGIRTTQQVNLAERLSDRGIMAEVDVAATLSEAREKLQSTPYDVAIVDLRFDQVGAASDEGGNDVIREITTTQVIPIIVYSGFPDDLLDKYRHEGLIYVAEKKRVEVLVHQIESWIQQRVFEIFSESGPLSRELRKAIQRTMWGHISKYWGSFQHEDSSALYRTIARLFATILRDQLSSDPALAEVSGEVTIHPGESYIFSTPRRFLSPGDILQLDGGLWAVLTPACDLVPRADGNAKATRVLLAHLDSYAEIAKGSAGSELRAQFRSLKDADPSKQSKAREFFARMLRHDYKNADARRFFLTPFASFTGGAVDFLALRVADYTPSVIGTLVSSRIVSLNPTLAAELSTRFSRFFNRLGQAPYDAVAVSQVMLALQTEILTDDETK